MYSYILANSDPKKIIFQRHNLQISIANFKLQLVQESFHYYKYKSINYTLKRFDSYLINMLEFKSVLVRPLWWCLPFSEMWLEGVIELFLHR